MRGQFIRSLSWLFILILASSICAQSGRSRPSGSQEKRNQTPPTNTVPPSPEPTPGPPQRLEDGAGDEVQDGDAVKVDINLVTVPIIASDRDNRYLKDLQQGELQLFEDDKQQQIAFFATVTTPFNVILMLDTSASTQEKMGQIQRAAVAFVEQLQTQDRVKVMSFDDQIRDLSDFTNDRASLRMAIYGARPGQGTRLYDAMERAINSFRSIEGRKAIVIFTDGVDSYSNGSSYDKNRRALEEAGIIVYPIRYDTRADVEAMIRQQQSGGGTIDLGRILGGGGSGTQTTPTTFPGGTVPTLPTGGGTTGSVGGIPLPPITIRRDDPTNPNDPTYDPNDPMRRRPTDPNRPNDMIGPELDLMYRTGDQYLNDLARITGGELNRADTLGSLPTAFARIAAELRTQYSLGYYPTNTARDGKFRKLKIKSTRKGAIIRARPGYRAPLS
jgi:VWFA-related protein